LAESNAPLQGNSFDEQIQPHLQELRDRIGRSLTAGERKEFELSLEDSSPTR
jgi:hypothetical protein